MLKPALKTEGTTVDRSALRLGAMAAVVGAIVGVVGNLLHPRAQGYTIAEELRLISGSEIWVLDHYLIVLATAISFIGLVVIARTFDEEPAGSWARIALPSAVLGTGIGLMTIFIDGTGSRAAATAWAANPSPVSEGTASALVTVVLAMFTGTMFTLFGVTPLFYGLAGIASRFYPKWLGYLALFAGALGLVSGSIQYLRGVSTLTANILFPISSLSFSLWLLLMGLQLWKRIPAQG